MRNAEALRAIAAALAGALFVALGFAYRSAPLASLDQAGSRLLGSALPLAVVFTRSGYAPALIGIGVAGVLLAVVLRATVAFPLLLVVVQLAGQLTANAAKMFFHRPRPDHWLFRAELGFSYPSGHAVTAIVFYLGWALLAWSWPLPRSVRIAIVCALAIWALGIGWSRIALGAHHVTDVLGGYLLGAAWLCIFLVLVTLLERSLDLR